MAYDYIPWESVVCCWMVMTMTTMTVGKTVRLVTRLCGFPLCTTIKGKIRAPGRLVLFDWLSDALLQSSRDEELFADGCLSFVLFLWEGGQVIVAFIRLSFCLSVFLSFVCCLSAFLSGCTGYAQLLYNN